MIGNSWWSDVHRRGEEPKLCPPRVVVSISGEPAPQEGSIEWTGATGKAFDVSDPPTGTTYIGRCVGKQLFISDVDEKKKKVEALVKIMAPSADDEPERVIGTFPSRPIKVISKPSKKRQSAKNLECRWHAVLAFHFAPLTRFGTSVHQPRFDDISFPSAEVTDRFDKVPVRLRLRVIVQGLGQRPPDGARPTIPHADAIVHCEDCQLG